MEADNTEQALKSKENQYTYPLQRYLKNHPSRQITSDLQGSLTEEDVAKLEVIKNIVKSAEIEINNIAASLTQNKEQKIIHLPEPNYFDEDFDQKSYIQSLVSAKIQGMKVVEQDTAASKIQKIMILKQALETISDRRSDGHDTKRSKTSHTSGDGSNKAAGKDVNFKSQDSSSKQNEISHFYSKNDERVVSESSFKSSRNEIPSNEKITKAEGRYTRLSIRNHKLVEIKSDAVQEIVEAPVITNCRLSITAMPSVNIRSELIEQKIPSLDIYPEDQNNIQPGKASNVGLIRSEHSDQKATAKRVQINLPEEQISEVKRGDDILQTDMFKNLTGQQKTLEDKNRESILDKLATQGRHKTPENSQTRHQSVGSMLNDSNQPFLFFDRSKSDNQYSSIPSTSYSKNVSKLKKYAIPEIQKIYNPKSNIRKTVSKKSSIISSSYFTQRSKHSSVMKTPQTFDSKLYDVPILKGSKSKSYHSSTEYIPYSKLTVGGLNADEMNKYIHESDKKINANTTQLTISSDEVSKRKPSVSGNDLDDTKSEANEDGNISDHSNRSDHSESSKERSKNNKTSSEAESSSSEEKSPNDYVDDFDDDSKSDSQQKSKSDTKSHNSKKDTHVPQGSRKKPITLKLKKSIEVFDFVHAIETKDDSTQSGVELFSNFKQTQTSPREIETKESLNEFKLNVAENSSQKVDVANLTLRDMMQIQKSLALLNINFFTNQLNDVEDAPACSKDNEPKLNKNSKDLLNVHSSEDLIVHKLSLPKDTQTSPLKSCHAMTSPTEMVSRILSPIFRDVKIDVGTSPCDINVSLNSEELTHNNVTFPKPQSANIQSSAREALSNLETALKNKTLQNNSSLGNKDLKEKLIIKHCESSPNRTLKDSTETYTDVSHSESSETHSLGEINLRILRKKSFIIRRQAKSDSNSNINSPITSSSSDVQVERTNYGGKSDGELSTGQIIIEK